MSQKDRPVVYISEKAMKNRCGQEHSYRTGRRKNRKTVSRLKEKNNEKGCHKIIPRLFI